MRIAVRRAGATIRDKREPRAEKLVAIDRIE
jgi:hypothetical protein